MLCLLDILRFYATFAITHTKTDPITSATCQDGGTQSDFRLDNLKNCANVIETA